MSGEKACCKTAVKDLRNKIYQIQIGCKKGEQSYLLDSNFFKLCKHVQELVKPILKFSILEQPRSNLELHS